MIQVILGFDHPKETQPYLILVLLSWRVTISLSEYYTTIVDEVPNQDFTHILLSKTMSYWLSVFIKEASCSFVIPMAQYFM